MTRRTLVPMVCLAVATASLPALARRPGADGNHAPAGAHASVSASPSSAPLTDDQILAQQHFQRAKDLYQAGAYRDAIAELEVARSLDPKAKDLVMNLGILQEKLGRYDAALGYFKTYLEMDVTPAERAKAESIIKRIEGAKRDQPPPPPSASAVPPPPPRAPEGPPPSHGRIDGATIAVGSIAAFFLVAGAAVGVYAIVKRPTNFVTGRDGSFADLQKQSRDAHAFAVGADLGLAVGILAAGVTALLYFGRTKDAKHTALSQPLLLGGTF